MVVGRGIHRCYGRLIRFVACFRRPESADASRQLPGQDRRAANPLVDALPSTVSTTFTTGPVQRPTSCVDAFQPHAHDGTYGSLSFNPCLSCIGLVTTAEVVEQALRV